VRDDEDRPDEGLGVDQSIKSVSRVFASSTLTCCIAPLPPSSS
jgi:hypothetical protein